MIAALHTEQTTSLESLWGNILTMVRQQLNSEPRYNAFFGRTALLSLDDSHASVAVPTDMHADYLEHHYQKELLLIISHCTGQKITQITFMPLQETFPHVAAQISVPSQTTAPTAQPSPVEDIPPHNRTVVVNEKSFYKEYRFDQFVVGSSNEMAYHAALAVAEAPGLTSFNPLVIYGKTGLGKTHLLQAIGHFAKEEETATRIYYISAFEFLSRFLTFLLEKNDIESFYKEFINVDLLLIDDIHFLSNKKSTQTAFYNIFTTLINLQKQIVLTSDRLPDEIPELQESLLNRFKGGLLVEVTPPTLETRMSILHQKAKSDNIQLSEEVIRYMAARVTNNVRMLEGIFTKVLASSIFNNSELSIDSVQDLLNDYEQGQKSRITVETIQDTVATYYEVTANQLRAHTRKREVSFPRNVAMYLARIHTKQALRTIGLQFGGRDYSTIIHASKKIESDMIVNDQLRSEIEQLTALILDA